MPYRAGHDRGMGEGDGRYIPAQLNVCPCALLTVTANKALIRSCLLHNLKRLVVPDRHYLILGKWIVFTIASNLC